MHKHLSSKNLVEICQKLKSQNKRIVFTYGTFDLIHSGHAAYLLKAKLAGDVLIVGVATNKSNRELRGNGLPLIDQKNRAELLSYFDFVDHTTFINTQNLLPTLKKIKPEVFFTIASDWKSHLRKSEEAKFIGKYDGKIIKTPRTNPYISASAMVSQVADVKIKEIVEYFFGKVNIDLSLGDWGKNKFSGLKASIREDSLYFGDHSKDLGLFGQKYLGHMVDKDGASKIVSTLKKSGHKVVVAAGACDLLHAGHARFYNEAKKYGDKLLLVIPSDRVIRKQKGRGRPIVNERSRAELMAFFKFVDYVIVYDEEDIRPLLETSKPDIFFTVKEDWNEVGMNSDQEKTDWGGNIVSVPPQSPKLSSSRLIAKAAGIKVRKLFKKVLAEAEKRSSIKD